MLAGCTGCIRTWPHIYFVADFTMPIYSFCLVSEMIPQAAASNNLLAPVMYSRFFSLFTLIRLIGSQSGLTSFNCNAGITFTQLHLLCIIYTRSSDQ